MPAAASERPLAEDRGVMILGKIRLAVGILYSVLFAFNVCASGEGNTMRAAFHFDSLP